ncbi:MAG: hypothetical protein ING41_08900 [Burkholderiales bacterium]|nr:hypothetical protein [Burkholderiales bacterium]
MPEGQPQRTPVLDRIGQAPRQGGHQQRRERQPDEHRAEHQQLDRTGQAIEDDFQGKGSGWRGFGVSAAHGGELDVTEV